MIKDKDLWKYRSWELSVPELKTKQKKCRTFMWYVFFIHFICFVISSIFFLMRYLVTSTYFIVIAAMILMMTCLCKFYEMNIGTIIEIRGVKE